MSVWHGRSRRKKSGGRYKQFRKKRKYEMGRYPALTVINERKIKKVRTRGGNIKIKLYADMFANVVDPRTNKISKVKILDVKTNPANADFSRRRIITKGAIITTELGDAVVTSRPGQDGIINAKLLV